MKHILIIFVMLLTAKSWAQNQEKNMKINTADDSVTYELVIFDLGFESWLLSQSKPINYYSETYLEQKNQLYVNEWNYLYTSGKYPQQIESYIDYNNSNDYGKELNYRLYQYFVYFEQSTKIKLLH